MPRPSKTDAAAVKPNAIIASAAKVLAGRRKNLPSGAGAGWQNEAWEMLDTVGELEFYREWVSNALSRCTLAVYEEVLDPETGQYEDVPTKEPFLIETMTNLFGGDSGQSEMLAAMAGHLAIPGETWLVGLVNVPDDPDLDMWRVLSRDEVTLQGKKWKIDRGDGEAETYAAEEVFITRIWRSHPRKWVEANSSVRSALPILRELVGLSKHVSAAIDSRLAGAGLLAVPSEITFASPVQASDDGSDPLLDPFMAALTEAMITAIEDRADASALAPIIVKGPAEHLDKIKHITFATPLSAEARELRKETIGRLANSLDVPAEVLLGMADVNHWTGWLLDENAIKMHIEPLLAVIASGLTSRYLLPVLQGNDERLDPSYRRFKIKGETSALRQRPNRSEEATAGHDKTILTDAAWARETGFDPDDLLDPTSDEFRRRVLMRLAVTGVPEVVVGALAALGITLDLPTPAPGPPVPGEVAPAAPAVEAPAPVRALPSQEQAASLLAVSEVIVNRAVERAWNKAGRRGATRRPLSAEDVSRGCLDGAWGDVPRSAALTGVDPDRLTHTLDRYARDLLTSGRDLNPDDLLATLSAGVLHPRALASRPA